MRKTVLNSLLFMVLILMVTSLETRAQQLESALILLPGIAHSGDLEPGMNGMGLELTYLHPLESSGMLKSALEAGYTGWGGQALLAAGYRTKGMHAIEGTVLNGLAFYKQGAAWVGGLQASWIGSFFPGKKNALVLSAGIRFSIQPAYRNSGPLWFYLDLPLRISWSRKLRHP